MLFLSTNKNNYVNTAFKLARFSLGCISYEGGKIYVQGKPRKMILGFVAWLLAALVPHWALFTAQLPVSWILDVLVIVFFGAELSSE
mmetsp:Transcript_25435/g.34956  ORF Transcript_25435/g.34956 Transcript_25435/m.34956 type:complete len:87 (-) Transcript_25435:337-597(-)